MTDQDLDVLAEIDDGEETFGIELPIERIEVPASEEPPELEHEDHERPPEPPVPEGEEVPDRFQVGPVSELEAAAPRIVIHRNVEVRPSGAGVSVVCEPTVASCGNVAFFTANWFAAISTDGGATFRYINPYRVFGTSPKFCCDQVVTYVPQIHRFIWSLQSVNFLLHRILFATPEEAAAGQWSRVTITPALLRLDGAELDYPDMAAGGNMLYWSTNVFGHSDYNSAIVRIPLAGFVTGQPRAEVYRSPRSTIRIARGSDAVGHFASHLNTSTLRVFSWPEADPGPKWNDVTVTRWNGDFSSSPWMKGAGTRVMGGGLLGDELWFAWNVGPRTGRPHPFSQIVRIDRRTFQQIGSADLWDPARAAGFASLAPNSVTHEMGVSFAIGSNAASHAVGILTGAAGYVITIGGSTDTAKRWGDYLSIREHCAAGNPPRPTSQFVASGFALDSSARARPHAIWFERQV